MLWRALGRARPEDYVEWATDLVCADVDGPNLRILAGLHLGFDRQDVEPYFLRTCGELGLKPVEIGSATGLQAAQLVSAAFTRGDVTVVEAIHTMADLYRKSMYRETLLASFWRLCDEFDRAEGHARSADALAALDDAVRREVSLLQRCLAVPLPQGWVAQSWCRDCQHVGELGLKPLTLLEELLRCVRLMPATAAIVCAKCGSRNHAPLRDPDVRLEYLDVRESLDTVATGRHPFRA